MKNILAYFLPALFLLTLTACGLKTPAKLGVRADQTEYVISINDTDRDKVLLLIDASLQAYNAFDNGGAAKCLADKVIPPRGYDFVECWKGVDSIFHHDKTVETYGVVFRSQAAPYTYIFAFRGTASFLDALDDLGAEMKKFTPYAPGADVPPGVKAEAGFFDVYSESAADTPSMQTQLFQLIDKYNGSRQPVDQLYITGHSLGSALSELFTLDLALSRPEIKASNINFASPRVGNGDFVTLYEQQPAQQTPETKTLRVQNTYDAVPCVPPEPPGYRHIPNAYLIAFHQESALGKLHLADDHSSANYSLVLNCAAQTGQGICLGELPAGEYELVSETPDQSRVCN